MSSTVGRNSLIMASGTAASRVTGQIRTILLAAAIGTTGLAANAYQAGAMIPQTVFTLVSGGIFNAVLVPQIVRTLKERDAQERLNTDHPGHRHSAGRHCGDGRSHTAAGASVRGQQQS